MSAIIQARDLNLWYGDHQALHHIDIDIPARTLNVRLSDEEIKQRMAEVKIIERPVTGVQKKYRKLVTSGANGAYLE